MMGADAHLCRVGASAYYAWDWIESVARVGSKFGQIKVCPLIPIVGSDQPGSLSRDIGGCRRSIAVAVGY